MKRINKAYMGLIIISVLGGISFPIMDSAIKIMDPVTFVAVRYLGAAMCMSVICIKIWKKINLTYI